METNHGSSSGDPKGKYLNSSDPPNGKTAEVNDSALATFQSQWPEGNGIPPFPESESNDFDVPTAIALRMQFLQKEMSELLVALKFFDAYVTKRDDSGL